MKTLSHLLLLFWLSLNPLTIQAKTFTATVIHVWDGDSLVISTSSGPRQVRIFGIDAPEKGQSFGKQAHQYLQKLIINQDVLIETLDQDAYKRAVARITLRENDIATMMIKAGYAWAYRRYNQDPTQLDLEQKARKEKRGLWQQNEPVAPWIWRKQQPAIR